MSPATADPVTGLVVTTEVKDPQYLTMPFTTTTHFKLMADAAGWAMSPAEPVAAAAGREDGGGRPARAKACCAPRTMARRGRWCKAPTTA